MGLRVENLSFSYDQTLILNDISFNAAQGELVGIIGPNGSGKTTLIKNILNILKPNTGNVIVDHQSISELSLTQRAKIISYVPQFSIPNYSHSVYYTVLMGRKPFIRWNYSEDDHNVAIKSLKQLNLISQKDRLLSTLSGGEKQKTLLARAITQECKYMLLDEPTNNLDLRHQKEVMSILKNLAHYQQACILIVIHDLNLASLYCDKLVLLNNGEKVIEGPPQQVITKGNLQDYYGVNMKIVLHNGCPQLLFENE